MTLIATPFSFIRHILNTVLVWSCAITDDISSRLQIPTGATAKMNLESNNVEFAAAPKDATGAALTSGTIQKSGTGTLKIATAVSSPGLNFDVPTGKLTINVVDDIPEVAGTLYAAIIKSPVAHGELIGEGIDRFEAIVGSTVRRFRPIMLTAAAAILAMVPLSRSTFFGPMAVAIMGGLTVATVLTILFLPALYAAWYRVKPGGKPGEA